MIQHDTFPWNIVDATGWRAEAIFLKTLTANDDSGRHGVLVPGEAYALFPALGNDEPAVHNPFRPITTSWRGAIGWVAQPSSFRQYDRYPERRLTSLLPSEVNGPNPRVLLAAKREDRFEYRCLVAKPGDREWPAILGLLGEDPLRTGMFRVLARGISERSPAFENLFKKLRGIANLGFVPTVTAGDTGVGMTLESLLGINPNSSTDADFDGIEIKSMRISPSGRLDEGKKRTLFSKAPAWEAGGRKGFLVEHGTIDDNDRLSIYTSIFGHRESRGGWRLDYSDETLRVLRHGHAVMSWPRAILAASLAKHHESVFVYAETRGKARGEQFSYARIIHAIAADIDRYLQVLADGGGCFDIAMHLGPSGTVRDHGFLFRVNERELPRVFRQLTPYDL